MRERSSILIALISAFLLGVVGTMDAATWYVNTATGNDAWTGVNSTNVPAGTGPKKTIQAMVNGTLASGDIISIAAGTYNEQVVVTDKSITLQGAGVGSTIIQPAAWAGLTSYTDGTNVTWTGAGKLPSSTFRPVIYVNASNTNFTVNINNLTVDGNSVATGSAEFLVGIMYKNAQGRIGATSPNTVCSGENVRIINCRKATIDADMTGFGVIAMANSVVRVTNCLINNFQAAGVLSLGRTTNTVNRNLQPNPEVTYTRITGVTRNTAGLHSGYMAVFGGRGTVSQCFIDQCRNTGAGYGAGVTLIDPFTHTVGGNNRVAANVITDNEVGLYFARTVVPVGLFPPVFTISNNTIAYNGNGASDATATGGVVLDDDPAGAYTLNVSNNAWGNALATTLYPVVGSATGDPAAGFFVYENTGSGADNINRGSAQSAALEYVDCNLPACDMGLGYVNFPTIQKAVNAAAINVLSPTLVKVAACNYAENVVIQKPLHLLGDSLSSCAGITKPRINPPSGTAIEISSTTAITTENVTINGIHFLRAGTAHTGVLVVGWDNSDMASNRPPEDVTVRNSCFEGYATQVADGTPVASASMATEEFPYDNTGRQSWGGGVTPATADVSDVDASANNNFNYNSTSTSPDFKLWEKSDGWIAYADYSLARIIKTDLIIVFCGDDLETVLGSLGSGPVTVYLQGDCVYKDANTLNINGNFEIKVDYTGRVQLPPVIVAPNGLRYGNGAVAGITWDDDCTIPTKPGIRFITRDASSMPDPDSLTNGHQPSGATANASATYMKTLTPANYGVSGFDYETTNYGWNRPTDIGVNASEDGALLDAISHIADSNGFAGTITLDNAAAFTTNITLQKRIRFAVAAAGTATTGGWIRLLNKAIGAGPCYAPSSNQAIDGILDTRVTSGTFTSMDVRVGTPAHATEFADNSDTTNTIQQGLVFTAASGTCQVNYRGNYTGQAPTISRTNTTLTSDDATNFVGGNSGAGSPLASITLNGSGICATPSDIIRFDVPVIYMANNLDCIQTALGNTMGNQDEEGVGNDNGAGMAVATAGTPRTGTVAFTYGGATAAAQTLTLDKDVKFDGDNTVANTNAGSLLMNLGAYGNPNTIVNSDNFCNSTVYVTQETGSGYTTIPDIQDGILLACTSGTVNIGVGVVMADAASTWGGATDTYNRDNTINKEPLTVQALNNFNVCSNDPAFIIDAASAWPVNAGRMNETIFSGFTTNASVFTVASGMDNITIQGFTFTSLTDGTTIGVIHAAGTGADANNAVSVRNNIYTNSSELFLHNIPSIVPGIYRSSWVVECNRLIPNANMASNSTYLILTDHTGLTVTRNYFDGTGSSNTDLGAIFRGVSGASLNTISRNVFTNQPAGSAAVWIGALYSSTGSVGNINFEQNRVRNSNSNGVQLDEPETSITATINIRNNFINTTASSGIYLSAAAAISHQHLNINNNSFENTGNGIFYNAPYSGTVCQINARGNWWEHVSGPTNSFNPLNVTPCTATTFGDPIAQNGTCTTGDQSMISFIPWWTTGTDGNAGVDGWQEPAAMNVLARVVRTDAAGVWQANHATIDAGANAIAANNEKVIAIQGVWGWLPAPGLGDDWGEYFSEQVTYDGNAGNYTGNEFRGSSIKWYDCGVAAMQTWHTYLATTNNINGPVPSGDATAHAPAAPITGLNETGFYIDGQTATDADNTTIRNFRIQGFSSNSTPLTATDGKAILFDRVDNPRVDACWIEGSNAGATHGTIGIYLDRCTGGLITSTNIGLNKHISSSNTLNAGIGVLFSDRTGGAGTVGPNTIGQNAATTEGAGLGLTNGHNIIRNCERMGISYGGGDLGTTSIVQYNTIQGMRDAVGTGTVAAVSGIYVGSTAGTIRINNNIIGGKGATTNNDNNVDITFAAAGVTLDPTSNNNTIRDSAQVVDGENYTVIDLSGTRGAAFRTFFSTVSGNTFSHAAILTTDSRAPHDFSAEMSRNQPVVAIGGAVAIYRVASVPMANTSTVYSAGSSTYNNIIQLRENAGWTIDELDQYYGESLSFQSTTGRMYQTIVGPAVSNGLDATSAHLISTGPGTGVAVTADGAENKYIRGGIVMHAIGNGLYGRVSTGAANKGDVYLQRAASGTDAGFVQFAYHASAFGSQALVTGTGSEITGGNNNTDKPSIIKAGMDDANDDAYATTAAQNRRTGVFQAGNGTVFTRETEPGALTGGNNVMSIVPNPTTGSDVTVSFRVPYEGMVRVNLYNALGQKVQELHNDVLTSGVYNARFDVNGMVNGQYYVRFETEYFSVSQPVSVMK